MTLPAYRHDVVCFGEILWDVLPDKSLPGGAPMNVAFHLKKQGADPALISCVGQDERGAGLVSLLQKSGISTQFVQSSQLQETGWVRAWQEEHNEMNYDIVQPVAWDFISCEPGFAALLAGASYFVFGSLAARADTTRKTLFRLLEAAPQKVLDINLRPPHFTKASVEALLQKADVLKMNEAELELIAGWYGRPASYEGMVQLLQDRYSIPTIIVTLGSKGAMVLHEDRVYHHGGYQVTVADTIGSGDAFLAGFLAQRLKGVAVPDALRFACQLGALIATYAGACPDYKPSEVDTLLATSDAFNHQTSIHQ